MLTNGAIYFHGMHSILHCLDWHDPLQAVNLRFFFTGPDGNLIEYSNNLNSTKSFTGLTKIPLAFVLRAVLDSQPAELEVVNKDPFHIFSLNTKMSHYSNLGNISVRECANCLPTEVQMNPLITVLGCLTWNVLVFITDGKGIIYALIYFCC